MTRREYLENKVAKREEWAAKAAARADRRFATAHNIVKDIPLGQPILVGHHSERRHRGDLDRMASNMTKGCEEADLAKHHESKAAGLAAQLETTIFSDDPDAVEALTAKIADLEAARDHAKAINAAVRKAKKKTPDPVACLAGLVTDGTITREEGEALAKSYALQPYHGIGYPAYHLTNLGANIRRLQGRIADVKRRKERTAEAEAAPGGVVIRGSADYVSVTFAEKPARATIDALKDAGFHWAGGSWSGYRSKLPAAVLEMVATEGGGA